MEVYEDFEFELIKKQVSKMSDSEKIMFYESKKKSEAIGLLLAIFLAGAGQIYAGKTMRGILCIIFFWLLLPWIYAIYDTYKTIKYYNYKLYIVIFGDETTKDE